MLSWVVLDAADVVAIMKHLEDIQLQLMDLGIEVRDMIQNMEA